MTAGAPPSLTISTLANPASRRRSATFCALRWTSARREGSDHTDSMRTRSSRSRRTMGRTSRTRWDRSLTGRGYRAVTHARLSIQMIVFHIMLCSSIAWRHADRRRNTQDHPLRRRFAAVAAVIGTIAAPTAGASRTRPDAASEVAAARASDRGTPAAYRRPKGPNWRSQGWAVKSPPSRRGSPGTWIGQLHPTDVDPQMKAGDRRPAAD